MRFSLVIPIYNGAATVEDNVHTVVHHFRERHADFELILVDDCSTDDTAVKLNNLQGLYPELRVLQNLKNQGKGNALKRGFLTSQGDFILFTDADLPYGTDGLDVLLDTLNRGADVVIGSRVHPYSQYTMHSRHFPYIFFRHVLGRMLVAAANILFHLNVSDTQCGIKGCRRRVGATVAAQVKSNRFAFDIEFLHVVRQAQWTIEEMPVNLTYAGNVTTVRILRDSYIVLRDLLKIKLADTRRDRPILTHEKANLP